MKYLSIGVLGLALAGCWPTGQDAQNAAQNACNFETQAHAVYVTFIGPLRSADARAKEAAFYAKVQALCAAGASPTKINNASANAQAARQK